VYILVCSDGSYYTGYTNDLEKRVKAHNCSKRGAKYTRAKRPVKVVWMREYTNKSQALKIEARIKNLTRVEKDNLVKNTVLEHI
jgi:putative endonuclease